METKFVREETMTFSQQAETVRNNQAYLRLMAEVRSAAREHDLPAKEVEPLLDRARVAFPISNGEFKPITDWMAQEAARINGARTSGNLGPIVEPLRMPVRNPFKKESWNLTEQMRLRRRDPALAQKLYEEANS